MGKATVVSHIGEGRYLVDLDYGKDIVDQRVQQIDTLLTQAEADKLAAEAKIQAAQAQLDAAKEAVNTAIENYRAAVEINPESANEITAMTEAATVVAEVGKSVAIARLELSQIELSITESQKEKAALQTAVVQEQKSLWCADYTENGSGQVATCEVPGEPNIIVVAPGARPHSASDGELVARGVMSPEQAYFNAAILPGWQKFKPTYRTGTISNINEDADTCTVSLESIASSAQALSVNQSSVLAGVPVQYMTCNAKAFKNGERVIVEFTGQDWGNPKVIGFADGPKRCPYTLTYIPGTGLSLIGDEMQPDGGVIQRVRHGEDGTPVVVETASPGYVFTGWSDGRQEQTRVDESVTGDIAVIAQSALFPAVVDFNITYIDSGLGFGGSGLPLCYGQQINGLGSDNVTRSNDGSAHTGDYNDWDFSGNGESQWSVFGMALSAGEVRMSLSTSISGFTIEGGSTVVVYQSSYVFTDGSAGNQASDGASGSSTSLSPALGLLEFTESGRSADRTWALRSGSINFVQKTIANRFASGGTASYLFLLGDISTTLFDMDELPSYTDMPVQITVVHSASGATRAYDLESFYLAGSQQRARYRRND